MIVVSVRRDKITVKGHAGYAPPGQDIVCAAISALVQVLVASVERLTGDALEADIQPGNTTIRFGTLSEKTKFLLASFLIGVKMTAESYPDHVRIEE